MRKTFMITAALAVIFSASALDSAAKAETVTCRDFLGIAGWCHAPGLRAGNGEGSRLSPVTAETRAAPAGPGPGTGPGCGGDGDGDTGGDGDGGDTGGDTGGDGDGGTGTDNAKS